MNALETLGGRKEVTRLMKGFISDEIGRFSETWIEELEKSCNIEIGTVLKIVKGEKEINFDIFSKIAPHLGIHVNWIFNWCNLNSPIVSRKWEEEMKAKLLKNCVTSEKMTLEMYLRTKAIEELLEQEKK